MGILRDVIDVIKTSVDTDELKANLTSKKYSSIATRASEGTLQFPVLISDSMDIETAQMVVKALERNYATFVQTVLSMNSVTKDADISQYLRQFHQNYNPGGNAFNTANIVRVFEEGYQFNAHENGNVVATETYNNTSTGALVRSNKEQHENILEDLRFDILNRKVNPRDNDVIYGFKNPATRTKYNMGVMEADTVGRKYIPPTINEIVKAAEDRGIKITDPKYNEFVNNYIADSRAKWEREEIEYRSKRKDRKDTIARNAAADQRAAATAASQIAKNTTSMQKDVIDAARINRDLNTFAIPNQMLKDNDVKKANELIATTMHARVHMVNADGVAIGVQDFILGIKGTMHPIKSEEMITNMVGACKNNNKVFNFLRWTTGEISFFKDFWLNIPEMKRDIANESKGASRWWIALKNRRALGKVSVSAFVKDKILPNATIVVSAEEVELIKTHYGYDLMNPYFMKKIMDMYYLLGFVVVDNSAQVAHFYFDGSTDFESVSFSGLEKENTRDERKFKEMLKVINRN